MAEYVTASEQRDSEIAFRVASGESRPAIAADYGISRLRVSQIAKARNAPRTKPIRLLLSRRPDGGLRVTSRDVPGLVLSGPDAQLVLSDLGPALVVLVGL